jgi:lysophospholipase L1-like esterase
MASRRLLPSLALAAASLVTTLLALEAGFRLVGVSVGTVQINRGTIRRSADPRLQFELKPGSTVQAEVEYRINAFGMRNPEVSETKAPGVRRIAVLGDSIAFGYWVSEADAFPRRLEHMLDGGGRVEVLNFGVPGYNLDQEIEMLRVRALGFSPDLVLVAFCLNDLEGIFSYEYGLTLDRSNRARTLPGRALELLLERSRFFSWLEYRLDELEARRSFVRVRNPLRGPLYEQAVSEQGKALEDRFGTLAAILKSAGGIPGLVAIFPTFGNRFPAYPHRDLHRVVAAAAQGSGLAVVDLLDCYEAYDVWDVRVDVVHPNPMGHAVAAHAIAEALCGPGWPSVPDHPRGRCPGYRRNDFPSVRGY